MCGLFGVIVKSQDHNEFQFKNLIKNLSKYSEVRGVDSSGFCFVDDNSKSYEIIKGATRISQLLKSTRLLNRVKPLKNGLLFAFGHTRLVTNGSQLSDENNQPVIKDGIVGVHNGIIVNDNEIWAKYPSLKRQYEIDTEVLISLLKYFLSTGMSLDNALLAVEKEIEGTISIALLFDDSSDFLVYSNYGSLYILTDYKSIFILASEKNILTKLIEKHSY
jgi:Glucosamine 6-phosphate synthetase, contains amidotransferase and phosphosugar isomerase domains